MDIPRQLPKKRGRRVAIATGVLAVVLIAIAVASLPTATPGVDRASVIVDCRATTRVTFPAPSITNWSCTLSSARAGSESVAR